MHPAKSSNKHACARYPLTSLHAVTNTPEAREYMTIGITNDEEVGNMSEINENAG